MKFLYLYNIIIMFIVTPLVGVWIEIQISQRGKFVARVTPLVGVWIEMISSMARSVSSPVTPLVGVWIEIPDH